MRLGVPWSVKGIRPEARETAREAARRSGMSLGDWLNNVILQQAAEPGVHAQDEDEDFYGDEMAGVHQRLDEISRRIDQFSRSGPAAYAPKRGRSSDNDQLAGLIARLDQRIEHFVSAARTMPYVGAPAGQPPQGPAQYAPPSIDRAVAEISARQRALNGGTPAAQPVMPSPALAPVPTQDLSGLEDQLRRITDQIETLRRPGVEEAINALRGELAEIGRALADAMPRREIEAIERQIAGLSQRIAEGRQTGADSGALGSIEHGLAEVRDTLRGLTPAESLVGFNEAVHALAHKIDLIVAQRDPQTLQQLEHAVTTLREISTHVASNEAVGTLAAQVQVLAEKVEQAGVGGASDALNNLEQRIDALSRALTERAQGGASVPPRLEALVQSLSDKIEQIQQTRGGGDNVAMGHLEDRIVSLVTRLDASDSRLNHLEAIERGLGDLLVHMQQIQAGGQAGGLRAEDPGVNALKHDLARTQSALEQVNGTLGAVVDRLATIEKDLRNPRPQPMPAMQPAHMQTAPAHMASPPLAPDDEEPFELTEPMAKLAVRPVEAAPPPRLPPATPMRMPAAQATPMPATPPAPPPPPLPMSQPEPRPAPRRLPPANLGPINPNLPPDEPLEPGQGHPRLRGARFAVPDGGHVQPGHAAEPEGGKTSFIAAARRAAKTAMQEAAARLPLRGKAAPAEELPLEDHYEAPARRSVAGTIMKRMKSVLVAASIVAIVVGGLQFMGNIFAPAPAPSSGTPTVLPNAESDADSAADTSPQLIAPPPAVSTPPVINQAAPPAPSLLAPPALNPAPVAPKNDVTGSISRAPRPATPSGPQQAVPSDRLPIAIGSAKLRNAAALGDAAAAYEIGTRFAEGRGVPVSYEEAVRWYERAAGKGLPLAQFRYAAMLEKGQGVKKDIGQARRLYLAAANAGNAKAMHNLAVLYAEGVEGRPDYATAAKWFRMAADRGVSDSQFNLGVLAARGLGAEKSLVDSYKWFALAGAQGDREAVRKRDEVATQLDPRGLAAAQQAAQSFVAQPQPPQATSVPLPAGGWEDEAPAASNKPRSAHAPVSLGAYTVGKR